MRQHTLPSFAVLRILVLSIVIALSIDTLGSLLNAFEPSFMKQGFHDENGIRQGFPLSILALVAIPLLLILLANYLNYRIFKKIIPLIENIICIVLSLLLLYLYEFKTYLE